MISGNKIILKYVFPLAVLLITSTFAEQGKIEKEPHDKGSASLPASSPSTLPVTEKFPHAEHVKVAGEHMVKLHQDLKRFPTHNELVKHLEKEMNINTPQAEKILREMDID